MQTIYLSSLQHYLFCPRQFALIDLECIWEDNVLTAEGQVMHQKVNSGENETRGVVKTARSLHLGSEKYGLYGIADVVEYRNEAGEQSIMPVEYKRGRPKEHRADEVQLCAQALCLEEMHQCVVPKGALFYGKTRRRTNVEFDEELRSLTISVIEGCRNILETKRTPKPTYRTSRCRNCSLREHCHPKVFNKDAGAWLQEQLKDVLDDD